MTHSLLISRRTALQVDAGAAAINLARPGIGQGKTRVLLFVPGSDLFSLDPLYAGAYVSTVAALMVFDQLYGLDASLTPRPQMIEADELSDDGLIWRFTLRKDLHFHDGEPVLAKDAAASIGRWAQRHPFGVRMKAQLDDLRTVDDRRFEIRLKKPFPQMRFALATYTCHVMPERLADRTNAFSEIKEVSGSGPYVFVKDEWASGARAVFRRNEHYVPREEKPSALAGGKLVNFDRVEWLTMPDAPTVVGALQKGEVDWWESPLFDLLPKLHASAGVTVEMIQRLGWFGMLYFNNRVPPFDNPKLRRALLPAVNQSDYMQALVGDQADLKRTGLGAFAPGSPFETDAGMEILNGPRDPKLASKLVKESGYQGGPVVLMAPADLPTINALSQVARQMMESVGLNVVFQSMDWGTVMARSNSKDLTGPSVWNCYCNAWTGLNVANPGTFIPLYGQAPDPAMEVLKDAWFDAPDLAAQKQIADRIQLRAFEVPPFLPLGQYFRPQAYRTALTGIVPSPYTVFWNARKA